MVRGGRRRRVPNRRLARRILVVTEGTCTEPQYVERLGSYLRSRGSTVLVKPVAVGKDPLKVVQKCIEQRDADSERGKGYDDCVCLVDVDNHASLPAAVQLAKKGITSAADIEPEIRGVAALACGVKAFSTELEAAGQNRCAT